jgi:thiol-disulfide isomerase/thioredoxin
MNSSGANTGEFVSERKTSAPVEKSLISRHFRVVLLCCIAVFVANPIVFCPQEFDTSALVKMHERAPEFPQTTSSTTQFSSLPSLPPTPAGSPRGTPDIQVSQSPGASTPGMAPVPGDVQWINSPALTMAGLRGKVVLIDFWEYTCINCIRTFDENKKWYERYHKYGLEIVGVHCPEFDIAYRVSNVKEAVKRFGLPYPVVVDDKFMIWNAYHNSTWPNRFLIDAKGFIRYDRSGEGGDSALEHAIQQLLKEANPRLEFPSSYTIPPEKDAFAPSCGMTTPEMYVGQWGDRGILSNKQGYRKGKTISYVLPASVEDGHTTVSGRWETDRGNKPGQGNGMIYQGKKNGNGPSGDELVMRYHARELYSVMNVEHGRPSRVYIRQDGKDLTQQNKGVDVQFDVEGHSYIEVREPRMYYLTANPKSGSHKVELFPTRSGLTINSFTFGNDCQTDFSHL